MAKLSIGIDLGTTNSCVAVLKGDKPAVVPGIDGKPTTPSVVHIGEKGPLVGKEARSFLLTDPSNTFVSTTTAFTRRSPDSA